MKRKCVTQPPPEYGSKAYWEQRYKSHRQCYSSDSTAAETLECCDDAFDSEDVDVPNGETTAAAAAASKKTSRDVLEINNVNEDEHLRDETGNETSSLKMSYNSNRTFTKYSMPGHEWYFTYEELSPLLLPLVLETNNNKGVNNTATTTGGSDCIRKKSILEIGCGDVPLGAALAKEERNNVNLVLDRIVCCDFSETVIDMLRDKQKKEDIMEKTQSRVSSSSSSSSIYKDDFEAQRDQDDESKQAATKLFDDCQNNRSKNLSSSSSPLDDSKGNNCSSCNDIRKGGLTVEYVVADARNLLYDDGTFNVVLDKGALDAMLSDRVLGIDNCVKMVAEIARVVTEYGTIMIVSHVNANTESGKGWLDEVVLPGLRKGAVDATWFIEAHGAYDADGESDDDDDDDSQSGYESDDDLHWDDSVKSLTTDSINDNKDVEETSSCGAASNESNNTDGDILDIIEENIVSDIDDDDDDDAAAREGKHIKISTGKRTFENKGPTVYIIRNTGNEANTISET